MLRAIIVDDEELSIKRLRRILTESGEVGSCHTFLNPLEAFEFVKANPVDIAFLDISMPEINGMKLSGRLLELGDSLEIVFVTGYDEYAVQAFDMSALDYLLKPVTAERVSKTLNKYRRSQNLPASSPAPAQAAALTVRLFNGFKVFREGDTEPLKLRSPKTEELFVYLICKRTVSREEIIDTLWHGLEPEKAWKNLNSTLYYIRKAIGQSKTGGCIIADRNEIRIDERALDCDLYAFERLLRQRQLSDKNTDWMREAEILYTGPLLKGKAYEWAGERVRRLEHGFIQHLEFAARSCLERTQPRQALYYFGEILKMDALREDIGHEVIRLLIELGRPNEALGQYHLLAEELQRELGVEPGPHIQELVKGLRP
ncbi:response regulator [Paenibacillus sp. YSY-4.3]